MPSTVHFCILIVTVQGLLPPICGKIFDEDHFPKYYSNFFYISSEDPTFFKPMWHTYNLRAPTRERKKLFVKLRNQNIQWCNSSPSCAMEKWHKMQFPAFKTSLVHTYLYQQVVSSLYTDSFGSLNPSLVQ